MKETIEIKENATAAEVSEQETAKPYTFRKLSSDDMFLMCAIVKKIGLKELKTCIEGEELEKMIDVFQNTEEGADKEDALLAVGAGAVVNVIDVILGNLPKCKEEIYQLLSDVSGLSVDAIRADALLFTEMLIDFFKKKEFPAFIKVVSKLFK